MRGAHAAGEVGVLERDGQAVQRPELLAARLTLVGGGGRGESALGVEGDDRVDGGVEAFDAVEVGPDDLTGRQLTTTDTRREVDGVEGAEFVRDGSGVGGAGGSGHGSPRAAGAGDVAVLGRTGPGQRRAWCTTLKPLTVSVNT